MLRLDLPPRGSIAPNSEVDPLKYYYAPFLGRAFRARIDLGLGLLDEAAAAGIGGSGDHRPARIDRLLEIGFGSGLLLPTLAQLATQVDGVDLASDPKAVRASMRKLGVEVGELAQGSATKLPFASGTYDAVVAFSILEHLKAAELGRALEEAARVLKPGGRFLVGCPAVHKGMNLAFAAIGFSGIDDHHFSSIHDVLDASRGWFSLEKRATWPRIGANFPLQLPLGWAPYNAVLLRRV